MKVSIFIGLQIHFLTSWLASLFLFEKPSAEKHQIQSTPSIAQNGEKEGDKIQTENPIAENKVNPVDQAKKSETNIKKLADDLPKLWWLVIIVILAVPCFPPLGICMVIFLIVLGGRYKDYEKDSSTLKASGVKQLHQVVTRLSIFSIYWGISLWFILFVFLIYFKVIVLNVTVTLFSIP